MHSGPVRAEAPKLCTALPWAQEKVKTGLVGLREGGGGENAPISQRIVQKFSDL